MIQILHYLELRTLNYGNDGRFLIMGHAGFTSSTGSRELVVSGFRVFRVQGLAILGFRACITRVGYFRVLSKPTKEEGMFSCLHTGSYRGSDLVSLGNKRNKAYN